VDFAARWLDASPYARELGVRLEALGSGHARLALPFAESNTNPGRVLHGGVPASLAALGAQLLARATLGEGSGPWHTAGIQVSYLAAARGEDVFAETRLLREGRELCFVGIDVATADARPIAHASALVRARFAAPPPALPLAAGDRGEAAPGPLGVQVGLIPYVARRGIRIEHMAGGISRAAMPWSEANADADGGVHEGPVLALLDTTGAMAAWAVTGPGPFKASTPALQAQILAPVPRGDLVAYGRNVARDGELLWSDVDVATASEGRVVARGTVLYRIVTGG